MDSGKAEYTRQLPLPESDFTKAVALFKEALEQEPASAEAHYFYGYALDKLNSSSGDRINQVRRSLTIHSSEQFEWIIRHEPAYTGELLVLDPYSKLSAIWGSQALAYLSQNKIDSALWALKEGKRRGGFLAPTLDYNRQILNRCTKNALLITSGDDITFPILYLQQLENFRPDVRAVDANLLHTTWYTRHLKTTGLVPLYYSLEAIDTVDYSEWLPTLVKRADPADTTRTFAWTVKPTYLQNYFLKGDKFLLDIVKQTLFQADIYFSEPQPDSTQNLWLGDHLFDLGLLSKLVVDPAGFDPIRLQQEIVRGLAIHPAHATALHHSKSASDQLNGYRRAFLHLVYQLTDQDTAAAKKLLKEMEEKFPETLLPFAPGLKESYKSVKEYLANAGR